MGRLHVFNNDIKEDIEAESSELGADEVTEEDKTRTVHLRRTP